MKSEGKVGTIIYYKHLKILEEANLTEEQIGKILIAAIRYDESGITPQFESPLSAFFTMIKYDLDANREKWEAIKQERSEAGKKGGRPKKAKEPIGFEESKETNRFLDFPPVKDVVNKAGFFVDSSTIRKFCDCGLPSDWIYDAHSFLDFVAERIAERYPDKTQGEQKALFISAVQTWDDLRDEYPNWRKKKADKDKLAMLDAAYNKHPVKCVYCGGDLQEWDGKFHCRECEVVSEIDKEKLVWEWRKM